MKGRKSNETMADIATEQKHINPEELHNLYASPNIIRVIKSRKMRWAGMYCVWER
jgi:hypothetical protein